VPPQLQVSDADSAAAKQALLQHAVDVAGTRTSAAQPAADWQWLVDHCALPRFLLARADALCAQSQFNAVARGAALLDAQSCDALEFLLCIAGPEHLSWRQSAHFGSWLAKSSVAVGPDVDVIRVRCMPCGTELWAAGRVYATRVGVLQEYMTLKAVVEERVEQGAPECVCSESERAAAMHMLQHVCCQLGNANEQDRRSYERAAMFSHMATCLSKWLQAGRLGSISVAHHMEQQLALKHMPAASQSLHAIIYGAEC
jgi:hypothetical protein